jgi:hypothetical protein
MPSIPSTCEQCMGEGMFCIMRKKQRASMSGVMLLMRG